MSVVARDQVTLQAERSADCVVGRTAVNADAICRIAAVECAGHVGADVVAGHHCPGGAGIGDAHAVRVAGNDVAFGGIIGAVGIGSHQCARGPAFDPDTGCSIPQNGHAIGADADVVALDRRAGGRVADDDAVEGVGSDDVARAGRSAAEDIARARAPEHRAAVDVAQRQ